MAERRKEKRGKTRHGLRVMREEMRWDGVGVSTSHDIKRNEMGVGIEQNKVMKKEEVEKEKKDASELAISLIA